MLLLAGCAADTECRQNTAVYMKVEILGDSLRLTADTARLARDPNALDTVRFTNFTGMEIRGLGRDSVICDTNYLYGSAKLPLRPDSTHTDFVISYGGKTDTLTVLHDNDMQFISLACGCFVFHTIESTRHTRHFIDSVDIYNSAVTTATDTHLKVYFHTW